MQISNNYNLTYNAFFFSFHLVLVFIMWLMIEYVVCALFRNEEFLNYDIFVGRRCINENRAI